MKKIAIGLGVLVGIVFLGLMIAPAFIPNDWVTTEIEKQATAAVGRDVTIDGGAQITLLPPSAKVTGLKVANPDGFDDPYLLQVAQASVGVALFPLLSGNIETQGFTLDEPLIDLRAKSDGTNNWTLGSGEPSAPDEEAPSGDGFIKDVSLGTVKVRGGRITYDADEATPGVDYTAEDANLDLTLTSLAEPVTLDGTMKVQGEAARIEARFSTPQSFSEDGAADLRLDMTVGQNRAQTEMRLSEGLAFDGNLDIDFPALRKLLALAGAEIGAPEGFDRLRLNGDVSGTTERLTFAQGTELSLDDISGEGTVTIALDGPRPKVTGTVDLGVLDLTPYLPEEPAGTKQVKEKGAAFPAWSEEKMDFSALRTMDTDLTVAADQVILPTIEVGKTDLRLVATDGDVRATIDETNLYGGTGTGTLSANARLAKPTILADMALTGVNVGEVATQLAGITQLSGTGNVTFNNLRTAGASQADFVRNLNGGIDVSLDDGAISGINLGKIGRAALQVYDAATSGSLDIATLVSTGTNLVTDARGPSQATDVNDLALSLAIANGVVTSDTLSLSGPFYKITGDGRVNLVEQSVDLGLIPAVRGEGEDTLRSLPIPIEVGGTFNAPSVGLAIRPFVESYLRGQATGRLENALGGAGIDLGEGETLEEKARGALGNALRDRLGLPSEAPTPAEEGVDPDTEALAPTEQQRPEDALIEQGLNALFGQKKKAQPEE